MNTATAVAIAALAAAGLLIWRCSGAPAAPAPGNPLTGSIALDLKVKAQSEFALRVVNQTASMRQLLALGLTDGAALSANLADAAALRAQLPETERQLATLGDSQESIARWLDAIHYDDFLRAERELRASAAH